MRSEYGDESPSPCAERIGDRQRGRISPSVQAVAPGTGRPGSDISDPDRPFPAPLHAELAHSLVADLAERNGMRALFIKGPVSNSHGLRTPRSYGDVDVFVEPARSADFIRILQSKGWARRPATLAQSNFVTHSTSYIHPSWPCDIDVHTTFPGLFRDQATTFDLLWSRRTSLIVGSRFLQCADRESSILISALHALRSPTDEAHRAELLELVRRMREAPDSGPLACSLVELARLFGSVEPLQPFFEMLGLDVPRPATPSHDYLLWSVQTAQASRSASWLLLIARTRPLQRPGMAWRALFPTRQDLLLDHPGTPDTLLGITWARGSRLLRAIRALPTALRVFLAERRTVTDPPPRSTTSFEAPAAARESDRRSGSSRDLAARLPSASGMPARTSGSESLSAPPDVFRRSESSAWSIGEQSALVVDLASSRDPVPVLLSDSAFSLWLLLDEPRTLASLSRAMSEIFRVEEDRAIHDIDRFLRDMTERGLVR